jgi:hypothetical protein
MADSFGSFLADTRKEHISAEKINDNLTFQNQKPAHSVRAFFLI